MNGYGDQQYLNREQPRPHIEDTLAMLLDGVETLKANIEQLSERVEKLGEPKKALTTREASSYLGVAVATLHTWRCQGKGPRCSKIGGKVAYDIDVLAEYIRTHEIKPVEDLVENAEEMQ